jgi:prolyl oligopeptidase
MTTPQTKKENIIDEINGILIADPYRWLEDNNSKEVLDWIAIQNQYTDSMLRNNNQSKFSDELIKNFKVVNFSNPVPVKGRYFYTERQPDEDQMVLYVKYGLSGIPKKLVDPNRKREDNTITINYWFPGWTGEYVVYGLSEGGDEMATLYVMDVDKNENLPEKIVHCRYSSVCWLPDDSGFFYTRNPRPGTVPKNEEHLHLKVYFHKLGDNPENDKLIFGEDRPKDDIINISLSLDGQLLAIYVSQKWTENEIYIYDNRREKLSPLITGIPSKFSLQFLSNKAILYTNYKANNYKILFTELDNLFKKVDEWQEFFPEQKNLLKSVAITVDKIILEYLVNACSEIITLNHFGKEISKVPLPQFSSLADISTRRTEKEFFYGIESFTFPKIVYRFNPQTQQYEEYKATDNPVNSDNYIIKQEWYTSKDKIKIPIFIFHKKGIELNGKHPTILYGYGGFASNRTPMFMRSWVPWIERNGIFAVANIRGGGEFGEKWHKAGIKENKQNSFDDFICAAEYLILQNYTDTGHLGILGSSNGGLLVSVVAVQRPDLFKAVCSRVPLTDMVRFPKFGIAVRWIHEYGNPKVKDDLKKIIKWSPYHNVKSDVEYPNILFTTANKDTRVDPLHARKMTALLQSVNKQNKVLVFTEIEAGHSAGKPISKMVELQSFILTFFAQELGLKV